jgi:RNA polymerase sigma factor (sigma-70 family)
MVRAKSGLAAQQLESLWVSGTLTGLSDAQLLARFSERGDSRGESAFRELIDRHGPMVMGVCRQILRRSHDADDAFQATFLVLVRKARSIQVRESLGPWLYSVAYRTALRARATASRYRQGDPDVAETGPTQEEHAYQLDLRPLLQEELGRLPEKYRAPIVLCHLEGKSHEEAARMLHWPVGTVSGRLSRGRDLLRSRLERRGVTVPSALLSANWLAGTSTAVPAALVESTLAAAVQFGTAAAVSSSVFTLTQGVLNAMLLNKLKFAAMVILAAACITGGAGVWAFRAGGSPIPLAQDSAPADTQNPGGEPAKPEAARAADAPVPPADASPLGGLPSLNALNRMQQMDPLRPGRMAGGPGGFMGPMGGVPAGASAANPSPFFDAGSIVVVESPDRRTLRVLSLESDKNAWEELALPEGMTAVPIAAADVLAFSIKRKSIDHVIAFSAHTGQWSVQHLSNPVADEIRPIVSPGCAVYQAGNDVYAFSARTGTWGALHLEGDEKPIVSISPARVSAVHGNRVYMFSLKRGEWSKGVEANPNPFGLNSRQGPAKKGRDVRHEQTAK